MKEAFWGVLIVVLGLFGIVVVNLFQNVTIDNDRVYYLIKESTEASAYDAIDLTYYRLSGNLRMIEDKFIENLTRRFAQNVTVGDYRIVVEDLNEVPPKVSLRIRSGVTSLRGEEFGLVNRVDGIIETKYKLEEVLEFLCEDKTTEECDEIKNNFNAKVEIDASSGENICKTDITDDEMECIPGDLKFIGWGSHDLPSGICQDESAPRNKERSAKYKVCECGKWGSEITERVTANPVSNGNEYTYTWVFNKSTEVRTLNESITGRVRKEVCTTSIGIKVPENYKELKPGVTPSSTYVNCPSGGVLVPIGTKVPMQGSYNPINSINRELIWTKNNTNISLKYDGRSYAKSNPNMTTCELNSSSTNCLSKNEVTATTVGTSIVTATNLRRTNQTATCKVDVFDGKIFDLSCSSSDSTIDHLGGTQFNVSVSPVNAIYKNISWSVNTEYAEINENGYLSAKNYTSTSPITATVTVKDNVTGKSSTCSVTIKAAPSTSSGGSSSGGGNCVCEHEVIIGYDFHTGKPIIRKHNDYGMVKEEECDKTKGEQERICHTGHIDCPKDTIQCTKCTYTDFSSCAYSSSCGANAYHDCSKVDGCYELGECKCKPGFYWCNGGCHNYCYCYPNASRCGNKSTCFLAGTKVTTLDGYKNIEDIEIGDIVLSYNEETGITEYNEVKGLQAKYDTEQELYEIEVNNEVIKVTENHTFYINKNINFNFNYNPNTKININYYKIGDEYKFPSSNGHYWISAKYLKVGDMVLSADGNYYPITSIIHHSHADMVYNFNVDNNHNYFVSHSKILVHNKIMKQPL